MTQNADVEFVRRLAQKPPYCEVLLAHIDQLEAELNVMIDNATEREMERAYKLDQAESAPSVDEIAVQMMASAQARRRVDSELAPHQAKFAYRLAEALVAERETRRWDGLL